MQPYGNLTITSGNWVLQNLTVSSLNVSSIVTTSTVYTNYLNAADADIAGLAAQVICSFWISTGTIANDTNYFRLQTGGTQIVGSSFMKYLSTGNLAVGNTSIDRLDALIGVFSTVSVGTWNVNTMAFNSFSLYDPILQQDAFFTARNGNFMLNGNNILSNTVAVQDLVSTTTDILFKLYVTSNAIDIRSNYSSLYLLTQSAVSSLSTTIGVNSNFSFTSISNLSVAVSANFGSLCNYTMNSISNVSTTTTNAMNSNFSVLTNYTSTSLCTLTIGLSTSISNLSTTVNSLSNYTNIQLSNLSTNTG
jgi:hypothetical protein